LHEEDLPMGDPTLVALLLELFQTIHSIAGYPVPSSLPEVHVLPLEQLQARVCAWACPVKAFYLKGEGVFIEQSLNFCLDPKARSILLHELVHHVQNLSSRFDSLPSCEAWYAREHEAYAIQNEYLRVEGVGVRQYMAGIVRRCD
jgi:hypothetical protein